MQSAPGRREFLQLLAAGTAGLSVARPSLGETETQPVIATKLADNYYLITGVGSNVLLLTGSEGSLLVDGGLAERSPALMKVVAQQSNGQPVRTLFNTHWHAEHTGSNEILGKSGAKIVAHENTKLWLGTDVFVEWQNRTYKPLPKVALPNETFYATVATVRKMAFGGEPIEYGYLPQAHTDGDIYVYFPLPNILMAGDVVSVGSYPILDYSSGGWIGGMSNASKILLGVAKPDTRIVPGAGPVQTRADLEAQQAMLSTVQGRLIKLMAKGMSAREMIAEGATKEFDAKWGTPELFIKNGYKGMWGHVRELPGSGII